MLVSAPLIVQPQRGGSFSEARLDDWCGAGNTEPTPKAITPDGSAGHKNTRFELEGVHIAHPEDTGSSPYTNHIRNGEISTDTCEFAIMGTAGSRIPVRGPTPPATELFATQREVRASGSLATAIRERTAARSK